MSLLRDCLNSYGYQNLDAERSRFDAAYDSDDEAFVHLFGPEKITDDLGEFLGYFMICKVMAGEELLRAAGTVTKKLAKWLGERAYLDPYGVDIAVDRGSAALRDFSALGRCSVERKKLAGDRRSDLAEAGWSVKAAVVTVTRPMPPSKKIAPGSTLSIMR